MRSNIDTPENVNVFRGFLPTGRSGQPRRGRLTVVRARQWLVVVGLVAGIVVLALAFMPFSVRFGSEPAMHARCRGALIESWPESASVDEGGWFNYAPNVGLVDVSGPLRASLCGNEARNRIIVPLLVAATLPAAVVIARSYRRRAA
jgi:hypothetical protein